MTESPVFLSPEAVKFSGTESARLGLIALATDLTSEGDLFRILPKEGASVYVTRVAFENPTAPENLRKMAPRLTDAAALLEPLTPLRAICYSCTAASVVIGDAEIRSTINKAISGVPVVTPINAARMAFATLGVQRIAVLTPYTIATSQPMAAYFSEHRLDITGFQCLGLDDDRDMARVSDQTIINAAIAVDNADAEALFISCTGLPAVGVIAEIEERIGKPVVTSNQASAWAMTRLAGFDDHKPEQYGQLFGRALPEHAFVDAA